MTDTGPLCSAKDLKEGVPLGVERDGRKLVVCKHGDGVRVLEGICPHRGAPLEDGFVDGGRLYCPWHGWAFDLETGAHVGGTQSLTTFPAVVEDGRVVI